MIKRVKIKEFRVLRDIEFLLGKNITVIAGQNGTGKSTLLGLIGNSCQIDKKEGETIYGLQFKTDFSEIFKASEKFDKPGSRRVEIYFCDENFEEEIDYRYFRTTWQKKNSKKQLKNGEKRFRVIPYRIDKSLKRGKKESKYKMPVFYLGLGRLYPVGEIKDELKVLSLRLDEEDKEWFFESYNKIFAFNEKILDFKVSRAKGVDSKKAVGFSTADYDYLLNSAGQDNLGQILLAILSFKRLKKTYEKYSGGLLLIDELEATLHPSAQTRLLNFLIEISKELKLQIIFTTHSIHLLQEISIKIRSNKRSENNPIELVYLSRANEILEVFQNPSYDIIENDLKETSIVTSMSFRKIPVYTEDAEARFWLKEVLLPRKILERLEFVEMSFGCDQLYGLRVKDPRYFSKVIIVADGDFKNLEEIKGFKNFLILPGEKSPEELIYNYLIKLDGNHSYWHDELAREFGFTKRYFLNNSPLEMSKYSGFSTKREKFKNWFNDHLERFKQTNLFEYWKDDNKELVKNFQQ